MLPTKFHVNWPFSSGEEAKKDFKDDGHNFKDDGHSSHLGFLIRTILAIFELQVTPMLPTKFQVNWPFGSGEEAKIIFSRWPPALISNHKKFSYFWSTCTSHPDASYQVSSQLAFQFWRRSEKQIFQHGRHWRLLGFLIRIILAVLIYKSLWCFLPSNKSIWPLGSGGEAKK